MMAHCEVDKLVKDRSLNGGEFTLYVNNLPAELNKHGLLQIFNHYGQVKGHFYRSNANWAYITYNTFLEAESAIKDLHDVPPLRLKVSFAKEKGFNEVQFNKAPGVKDTEQYENHTTKDVTVASVPMIQTKGRGNPLSVFEKVQPNPGLPKYTYTADNDLLYPYPSEPYTYNPYENADPCASTNTLWTRGQMTITPDGKRHVSLGRGYTMYTIPDPDPKVHDHINKVYEKRTSGLYEYGNDMLQNAIGTCKICSKRTKFTCERCHTFYCNRNCQVIDWPQHRAECEAIPALVTASRSMTTSQSKNQEQTPTRNISNIQIPLRRPKKLMNTVTDINEVFRASKDKDISNISATVCNNNANDKYSQYSDTKNTEIKKTATPEQNYSSLQNSYRTNSVKSSDNSENVKKLQKFNINDVKKIEEDISFSKHTFLSETKFTDVKVMVNLNRGCWVQKVEDEDRITELMLNLQDEANRARKVKPVIENMYAVKYESVWHRAIVIAVNPPKVRYIDYGNEEIIESDDFREIHKYKNIPRLCAKIRFSEKAYEKYKDLKYESIISVKMISIDSDDVINVEVQNENDQPTSEAIQPSKRISDISTTSKVDDKTVMPSEISINDKIPSSSNKLKSIVNAVTIGETGILEIHAEIKNNAYGITLLPNNAISDYEKLLSDLPTMCAQAPEYSNHKSNIGDLICGQRTDGDWLRGYILSLEPILKMAIVDEARIMPINKIVPCSEDFRNICAFGAVCEVTDTKYKFNESDQYEFKVIATAVNNEQDKIEVEILKEQNTLKGIIKPWVPMPEQKGIQYAPIESEFKVSITAYRSHNILFARRLDTAELEYYNQIMQNVAKCAQRYPDLKEPPVIGQMVIAQYTDDNYYRAIVTKIQDDKIAVSYVDFGNTEITNIKKLKILSNDLKQLRSCTTKMILKDVPNDIPMTKEVNDYLSNLVGTEVPLICTFNGIPSKDGVYLKLCTGEIINETITKLLAPPSKKTAEKDKTCYMADDLSTIDLGNVGTTVEALVLHSVEDSYKYAICPLDHDLMTYILDIMPKKMTAYCEESDYYIPREKELCLALYEGGWYRAVCVCRSYTPTTSAVFFVDFGNTEFVNHKDIRLMPKEFMTPNSLAIICNIVNIAPTDNKGRYSSEIEKRISELVVPDNYVKIKIVRFNWESGIYNVELPLVRTMLIEEGLISA